jgi:hypothetical protein
VLLGDCRYTMHSVEYKFTGRVPGSATYTRLKVNRETGARYLHYMKVGTISYYNLGNRKLLYLYYTEVGMKVRE